MIRTILTIALVLGLGAGVTVTTTATAQATGVNSTGSILYVKNHDVYAITPNGAHVRRITHNGSTATHNRTGGIGYDAPSASNSGKIIVALRNQKVSAVNTQGWLHVMNRNGRAIRTFNPPQFKHLVVDTAPCKSVQEPRGIIDAIVSPDGKHIVYTVLSRDSFPDCSAGVGYSTYVVKINGTGGAMIKRGGGNGASIEAGQWVNNRRLLLDDVDFGSTGFWYADLPSRTAHKWTQAYAYGTDAVYGMPALHRGKLASVGFSENTGSNALRLWSSSGPPARPNRRCDLATPVGGDFSDRPSWSPRSDAVAYSVNDSKAAVRNGEGLYVLPTATLSGTTCRSPRMLMRGATAPFWTPAGLAR
ncbi:MAG TPA: hypothetical protein VGH43_08180 [Jatrophihabitans sp.]|jgi:hypothetical protein